MPRAVRILAPLTALALTTAGCGALTEQDGPSSEDGVSVAAAFYALQYVTDRVAGDDIEVENLTLPGGEPHDLELGVRESALISDADLLVYLDGMQPAVDEAVAESANGEVLDAATAVDLVPFEDEHDHAHEGDEHADEEHADEEHADEEHADEEHADEEHADEEHADEEHDHGEDDPHFWHDPIRMADLGDAVAEALAEIAPDDAATFEQNAAALRTDLEALDEEFRTGLGDCEITTVVTNHDAFGYLEKYGLDLESINGITPDAEPTPAALADLQDLIEEDGITTVFSESLVSPAAAESLANDAGVDVEVLDPIEGLTDETADEDYVSLMRHNLALLEDANRC
ncbi:zinc ABC transporter substrate-binding protein [Nocardioides sp. BGMRC 2183]|nr:zinc ABC transporter substrate-binding protein [Nocardioides sp. BGMRC 2183]